MLSEAEKDALRKKTMAHLAGIDLTADLDEVLARFGFAAVEAERTRCAAVARRESRDYGTDKTCSERIAAAIEEGESDAR